MTSETASEADTAPQLSTPVRRSLSGKLLLLTACFVLLAELLIFPPSAANFRANWLQEKLAAASAAGIVLVEAENVSDELRQMVLEMTDTRVIAVEDQRMTQLLAGSPEPFEVDEQIDMSDLRTPFLAIPKTMETLIFGGDRLLQVRGSPDDSDIVFEIIVPDHDLRAGLLTFSRNIALLSLLISVITGSLVFLVLNRMMIRPIRNMIRSMLHFGSNPENHAAIIRPSRRRDEIGLAERELASMQQELNRTLGEQRHLADLGLAVSKINHDMRNVLTVAQMLGDRLTESSDPTVQRFAPRLIEALNRAIAYTQSVMDYGRATERAPERRRIYLSRVVEEVRSVIEVQAPHVEFVSEVPKELEVEADAEHLFRVLNNLASNAAQVLSGDDDPSLVNRITIRAQRTGAVVSIEVADTGPGLPKKARENLFAAFRGSTRSGGTGLGLAIANELIRAHGGELRLLESRSGSTRFGIQLPDAPLSFSDAQKEQRRSA